MYPKPYSQVPCVSSLEPDCTSPVSPRGLSFPSFGCQRKSRDFPTLRNLFDDWKLLSLPRPESEEGKDGWPQVDAKEATSKAGA
ncbi:unnamed protein product [Symbiodinium sp. CCMP2592]|nr:unnamed protein product [Symbiodinium sp. CCMP2592]